MKNGKNKKEMTVKKNERFAVMVVWCKGESDIYTFPTKAARSKLLKDFKQNTCPDCYYVTSDNKAGMLVKDIKWDLPAEFCEQVCPDCREEAALKKGKKDEISDLDIPQVQMELGEKGQTETYFILVSQRDDDRPVVWGFESAFHLNVILGEFLKVNPEMWFKVAQGPWTGSLYDLDWKDRLLTEVK